MIIFANDWLTQSKINSKDLIRWMWKKSNLNFKYMNIWVKMQSWKLFESTVIVKTRKYPKDLFGRNETTGRMNVMHITINTKIELPQSLMTQFQGIEFSSIQNLHDSFGQEAAHRFEFQCVTR